MLRLWTLQSVTARVRPRTRAAGTLWWFLTGINPDRVEADVLGTLNWEVSTRSLLVRASATFERTGRLL